MNKTLIAIFSIVVLPLGLVVGVSAADPDPSFEHSVEYSVLSDRSISVEAIESGGTKVVDFGTIAKTGTFEKTDVRLKFTAEDATESPGVKITAKLDVNGIDDSAKLSVSPDTVSGGVTTDTLVASSGNLSGNPVDVITGAYKASDGIISATSDLTYKLVLNGAQAGTNPSVYIIYTLTDD